MVTWQTSQIEAVAALLIASLSPGVVIGVAWRKWFHQTDTVCSKIWNGINVGILIFVTAGYLHFATGCLLAFSPWSRSISQWLVYRNFYIALPMEALVAFVGSNLVIYGRGFARVQIACAAFLFAIWMFVLFCMAST